MSIPIRLFALALAAALALTAASAAHAGPLEDAKNAGYVGEKVDGTLGIVRADAPQDVQALVEEINEKRLASYREIAAKNGIPLEAVAHEAGKKLISRTESGHWVQANGVWIKKAN